MISTAAISLRKSAFGGRHAPNAVNRVKTPGFGEALYGAAGVRVNDGKARERSANPGGGFTTARPS